MRHYYLYSILVCIVCSFNTLLAQQERPSSPLSIAELVDMGLQNNPQTQATWWNSKRAAAAEKLARTAYKPQLSLRGKIGHGYDYQFIKGEEVVYTAFEAGLCLSYLLLDFGERRADCQAAAAALMAADWQSDWAMQKVIFEVLSAAYAYLGAKEALTAREASVVDLKSSFEDIEELYRCGLRSISDRHALKAAFDEAKMEVIAQRALVGTAYGDLIAALGLSCSDQLTLAPLAEPPSERKFFSNIESLICQAERQRTDLQAIYAGLAEKEAIRQRVVSNYMPKLRFDADGGAEHYSHDSAKGWNYNLALTFSAPLYTGGEATARQRMAMADVQAARVDVDQLRLTIAKEINACSLKFEASQELLEVVMSYLKNAEQSFDGVLERYKAGTNSIFDLTAAQKQLTQARLRRGEAKAAWYRDLAGLAFSIGVIVQGKEICTDGFE